MPTTWKNKMIEQDFNHAESTVKEMTDLFEKIVETWSLRKKRKNLQQLPRNPTTRKVSRSENEKTLTLVL